MEVQVKEASVYTEYLICKANSLWFCQAPSSIDRNDHKEITFKQGDYLDNVLRVCHRGSLVLTTPGDGRIPVQRKRKWQKEAYSGD